MGMSVMSMNGSFAPGISVIIPAFRAAGSITVAIRSALEQPLVKEVVVIDDCSPDLTVEAAWSADDGTGRLRVVTQTTNGGPAAARNRGISIATSDFIAVLDADDYFLPGRFEAMFANAAPEWDVIADNIAFIKSDADTQAAPMTSSRGAGRWLDTARFIQENITQRGMQRGELGFLKPVFRREFVLRSGLSYDAELRLGEDFAFYVRLLLAGARFWITAGCGYVAIERAASLSGAHCTSDLENLLASDDRLIEEAAGDREIRKALHRHRRNIYARHRYRSFLDVRRRDGMVLAFWRHLRGPADAAIIARSYLSDKTRGLKLRRASKGSGTPAPVRFLLEA